MNYTIRPCNPDDLEKLLDLFAQHAVYEKTTFDYLDKQEILLEELFKKKPKLFCLVAIIDTIPIGYLTYTFDYSSWDAGFYLYMECLFIEEAYRGFKIGKHFIEIIKKIAIKHNCINIQWQTPDFNKRAIQFYEQLGASSEAKLRFTLDL